METMGFDASRYLRDENECRLYLADMMAVGSPGEIQGAIADVIRALKADVHPGYVEQLADGIADFSTIVLALSALNMTLTVGSKVV